MVEEASLAKTVYDRVPGFQGYLQPAWRADSDGSLRSYLAKGLVEQRDRLAELEVDLLARGDSRVAEIDRAVMELQLLIDALKRSVPGDGAWVSQERLREEDVELLHRADGFLLSGVDRIAIGVAEIVARRRAGEAFAPLVGDVVCVLTEMAVKLGWRAEIIQSPLP